MPLTNAQYTTLRNDIVADPAFAAVPNNTDGNFAIAAAYNQQATPAFTVWRTAVTIEEVGDNIVGSELANLASAEVQRLLCIFAMSGPTINPSQSDRRAFFNNVFAGATGPLTRPKLLALWKRTATRAEKLFANTTGGDGSNATPARLKFEGELSYQDVELARQ